jgi:hypothetical protein
MEQGDFARLIEERVMDFLPVPVSLLSAAVDKGQDASAASAPTEQAAGGDFGARTFEEQVAEAIRRTGGSIASPQKMVELSKGLEIHVEAVVKQTTNLASGEGSVVFDEQHRGADGSAIKVPTHFLIGIPVFHNDLAYRLPVRLRYRKQGGKLVWSYEIWRPDLAFDEAFDRAVKRVQEATALPLYLGSQES